mgnify:CR=1 FL=1
MEFKFTQTIIWGLFFSLSANYIGKKIDTFNKDTSVYIHLITNLVIIHVLFVVTKSIMTDAEFTRSAYVPFSFFLFSAQPRLKKKVQELST